MSKRKTKTDGKKREYYNSLFTELQHILKRLNSWEFKVQDGGTIKHASDLEKLQLLMTYHQAEQQKKYTKWFIVLTIVNILILTLATIISIYS